MHNDHAFHTEVAVRQPWHRRDMARRLMSQALHALVYQGVRQVRRFTHADHEQRACTFYEQLGFREVRQHIFYRQPFSP